MGAPLPNPGEIYDANAPRIYRYIYHRLGNQALAQDLTSEVFIRWLGTRTTPDNLPAFLYRIAHNLVVDHLRRNPPAGPLDENMAAGHGDPVQSAELDVERSRVRRALRRLTPEQEQVIVLKFLEGLSNEEIAQVVGKPVGAVKALQHRAMANLRLLLAEDSTGTVTGGKAGQAK